jgi:uncharacterized protein DUF4192
MTTSLPHTHIRLRDLSELVAGIPFIIGFPPTDSLVLYTFRRCPELGLSSTIRVNLPRPDHVLLVAEEMAEAVARNEAAVVVAVVVAENGSEHQELIEMLRKTLEDKNILLTHSSWVSKIVHGEPWQCYDDPLCTDTVPDPQSSALAAATAVAGDTVYPDRETMAAHLAPDPEEMLAYRRKLLSAYRASSTQPYTDEDLQADMEILGHALDKATTSYELPTLTDHQMVRLARALSQGPVKDECLAMALSDEPEAAERLWTVLIRGLPAPDRAEPAFLLAMSAYLRGAGVIAALALKIVMEANPLHRLAVLLDYALQRGMPPDHLRDMLVTSVLKNNEDHTDQTATEDDDPPWDATPEPPSTSPTSAPSTVDDAAEPSGPESSEVGEHTEQPPDANSSPPNGFDPTVVTPDHVDHEPTTASAGEVSMTRIRPAPTPPVGPADPSAHEETPAEHERARPAVIRSVSPLVGIGATANPEQRRIVPWLLSGRSDGAPDRRTVTMDALTAFLPPPTDRRGPW